VLARRTTTLLLTGHGKLTGKTTLLSILMSRRVLGPFLPCENNARSLYDALLPLRALTRANLGLALFHHPGKANRPIGLAARGSTAFLGHVDISIEMRQPGGDPLTRRRHLHALSRFAETPRRLDMELNADATDYVQVAETAADDFERYLKAFRMVLEDAPQKLTRGDILAEWPADFDKPCDTTLKTWLGRAVERGIILCEGTGRKADPYRYWLRETEAKWREQLGPELYNLLQERQRECGWTSLQEKNARDREDDTGSPDTSGTDDAP
jgi:hypothetical protein